MSSARRFALVLAAALSLAASGDNGGVPRPALPAAEGERCVEPTDVMRRDHMTFLFRQRDATVHRGIRTERHSLKGCVDCHAAYDDEGRAIRVDAPGQFCASCHRYAAVEIDCFECHAAVPAGRAPRTQGAQSNAPPLTGPGGGVSEMRVGSVAR